MQQKFQISIFSRFIDAKPSNGLQNTVLNVVIIERLTVTRDFYWTAYALWKKVISTFNLYCAEITIQWN